MVINIAMLKKLIAFVIVLFITGVALTLSLPEYEIKPTNHTSPTNYTILQSSLRHPLSMEDFLLTASEPLNTAFALRLGLYSQLQHAIAAATEISLPIETSIIKAKDHDRQWYLLLHGMYTSMAKAEQKKLWLQNNQISATLVKLPKSDTE